jgi:phosphoglycolate phosphatase-like HAD superfamily hydrolase
MSETESNDSALTQRPVVTVLDLLRKRFDHADFDAVAFTLDSVVVDLGYGDVRPLPGSVKWIDKLRDDNKKIAVIGSTDRTSSALELAKLDDKVDVAVCGPHAGERLVELIEALGVEPGRMIMVGTDADDLRAAEEAGIGMDIGLARGSSTPEQLRKAGADAVLADLEELIRVP